MTLDTSSETGHWIFSLRDIVENSPSRRDGVSYTDEKIFKTRGAKAIIEIGNVIVPPEDFFNSIGAGAALFHRLLTKVSCKEADYEKVAVACLFIATGSQCFNVQFHDITEALFNYQNRSSDDFEPTDLELEIFRNDFTDIEFSAMKALEYEFAIDLPYNSLFEATKFFGGPIEPRADLQKAAHVITTICLLFTDWTIRYSAPNITAAAIHIAAIFQGVNLKDFTDNKNADEWWNLTNPWMRTSVIAQMTDEFMKECRANWAFYKSQAHKIDPSVTLHLPGLTSRAVKVEKPKGALKKTEGPENKEAKEIIEQGQKENKPQNKVRHDLIEKNSLSSSASEKASRTGLKLREPNAANKRPAELGDPLEDPKRICL